MKVLFKTDSGELKFVRQWFDGDEMSRLPNGNYLVFTKTDSIIIRCSGDSSSIDDDGYKGFTDDFQEPESTKTVEELTIHDIDLKIGASGVIRYIDGLRYSIEKGGIKERFPANNEPVKHKGKLFTGRIDETGKYIVIKKAVAPVKAEKVGSSELEELTKLAASLSDKADDATVFEEEKPFDENAAFDDMIELSNTDKDSVVMEKDKLTLTVVSSGSTYVKTFKTEAVAERQFEMIKATITDDPTTIADLVSGPSTTFVKK